MRQPCPRRRIAHPGQLSLARILILCFRQAAPAVPVPLAVRELSAISARAMGLRAGGALLARPDGTPAGLWPHAARADAALRGAVAGARSGAGVAAAAAA